jgi:hypothetical protein
MRRRRFGWVVVCDGVDVEVELRGDVARIGRLLFQHLEVETEVEHGIVLCKGDASALTAKSRRSAANGQPMEVGA